MPYTMPFQDPTSPNIIPTTYIWIAEFTLNFTSKTGRITFFVNRDIQSAFAGLQPVGVITIPITPEGRVAITDGSGNIIQPALPSFSQIINANSVAYGEVSQSIYNLLAVQFPGSTILTPTLIQIVVEPPTATITIGSTQQCVAYGGYDDSTSGLITTNLTWSSDTPAVATVDSTGLITAVSPGTANIMGMVDIVMGYCVVTVPMPTPVSLAVSPAIPTIDTDDTIQFTATATYSDNSTGDITDLVAWSSSNLTVATISGTGLASATGAGTTTIIAIIGSISGQDTLTVSVPVLTGIGVVPGTAIDIVGSTQQMTAMGVYSDGDHIDVTSQVTWSSSVPAVATIDETGLVTVVAPGSTIITAILGTISDQSTITVPVVATLVSIAVTPYDPTTVSIGDTVQFAATGTYSDSSYRDLTNEATWSSDNTAVATVSTGGLATAVNSGTANIIATIGSIDGSTAFTIS